MRYNDAFLKRLAVGTSEFTEIIVPTLKLHLHEACGATILDLGCGCGRYSRLFAEAGGKVVGVDRNAAQIRSARSKETKEPRGIRYIEADFFNLDIELKFDIVLMAFVLLDLSTPQKVAEALSKAAHLTREGGSLIIVDVHPHNLNRENAVEFFRMEENGSYFDNGGRASSLARLKDGSAFNFFPNYHYRLDFILNIMADNGMFLRRVYEPKFTVSFPTHMVLVSQRL